MTKGPQAVTGTDQTVSVRTLYRQVLEHATPGPTPQQTSATLVKLLDWVNEPGTVPQPAPEPFPPAGPFRGGSGQRPLHEVNFLTVAEAAAMLEISAVEVHELIYSTELPAVRVASSYRIPEQAVREYRLMGGATRDGPAAADERPRTPLHEVNFFTVAETASVMRISKMTVYRLVHSSELPAIRVGRSFRIPEQAVHDYLRENQPDPADQR